MGRVVASFGDRCSPDSFVLSVFLGLNEDDRLQPASPRMRAGLVLANNVAHSFIYPLRTHIHPPTPGLLPLLSGAMTNVHVSIYAGRSVAVDVSCWLHKGLYACALDLLEGKDTQLYVDSHCFDLFSTPSL